MSGPEVADVSLCLIVKNEAQNVGRCLRSVAGVVSETVVLDTGSSDETVAIAEACGARVHHAPWENDFSRARNTAIDHARCGWILVLDADEELGAGWSDVLRGALGGTDAAGFRVIVENLLPAADVARVAEAPSVRLFRNVPGYRYENAIHEQVRGPIERLGGRSVRSRSSSSGQGRTRRRRCSRAGRSRRTRATWRRCTCSRWRRSSAATRARRLRCSRQCGGHRTAIRR